MVLGWEDLQEVFVILVAVVVLPHWRFLRFQATFPAISTPPWLLRPVKASTSSELYSGYFRLLYFCQAFPSQPYRRCYGFERTFFTHKCFLRYTPSPHFGMFCDVGRNTPSRILLYACPHKVVLSGWCIVLNYSYCRYKTIGLPIAPVSQEV